MLVQELTTTALFPEMPDTSKVWVYQANRVLTIEEEALLKEKATLFVKGWESHGSKLKADFTLLHHLFLVFSVDENQHEASGCSIDKSVHFVKEIQNGLGIDFFDRTRIAYCDSDNLIQFSSLAGVKQNIAAGEINNNTLIFNNLVNNLVDLRSNWIIPAGSSWLSRFF